MKLKYVSNYIKTPIGMIFVAASDKGVSLLEFTDKPERLQKQIQQLEKARGMQLAPGKSPILDQLEKELQAYFAGKRTLFTVPLDFCGTDFQQKAWHALQQIPYGETRSYQQQAQAIDNPRAIRAVAAANHYNRLSILIPCHRVIAKDGSLAGYAGDTWRKRYLLDLEAACA